MKTPRLFAWISLSIAGLLIILAGISMISKGLFGINHVINYFHVANSFILIAIAVFIATKHCCCDRECKCEDKKEK
jgi:hypothetical protein